MFENKIGTQQQAGNFVAPAEQSSVLKPLIDGATKLLGTVQEFARQEQESELIRLKEQNAIEGQNLALGLMQEYEVLKGTVGPAKARLNLETKYRENLRNISSLEQRESYMSSFRDVFGGSPTAMEVKAEDEAIRAEADRRAKLAEKGRNVAAGLGRELQSEEEAIEIGQRALGAEEQYAATQRKWSAEDRSWTLGERSYTLETRARDAAIGKASAAVTVNTDLLSNQMLTDISRLAQSGDEAAYQQAKARYLNLLDVQGARLQSFVNEQYTASGGVGVPPAELYTQTQAKLTGLRTLLTGETIRDRNVASSKLFESQVYVDLIASGDPLAKHLAVSAVLGAPVPGLSAANISAVQNIDFKDPTRGLFDAMTTATKVGPAATARVVPDYTPPKYIRDMNNTARLPAVAQEPEAKRTLAEMAVNTMEDATVPKNKQVLGQGGIVEMHRAVASGAYDQYREEIAEQILSTGQSAEELFQAQMETFTRTTLVPSLRLTAPVDRDTNLFFSSGPVGAEVLKLQAEGGKVRIVINESKLPSGTPVIVQPTSVVGAAASLAYGKLKHDPSAEFKRNVKKAEQDLNVMLMSYSRLTGEDASTLAQAYVNAFSTVVPSQQ